jgi:hypothetical protein
MSEVNLSPNYNELRRAVEQQFKPAFLWLSFDVNENQGGVVELSYELGLDYQTGLSKLPALTAAGEEPVPLFIFQDWALVPTSISSASQRHLTIFGRLCRYPSLSPNRPAPFYHDGDFNALEARAPGMPGHPTIAEVLGPEIVPRSPPSGFRSSRQQFEDDLYKATTKLAGVRSLEIPSDRVRPEPQTTALEDDNIQYKDCPPVHAFLRYFQAQLGKSLLHFLVENEGSKWTLEIVLARGTLTIYSRGWRSPPFHGWETTVERKTAADFSDLPERVLYRGELKRTTVV